MPWRLLRAEPDIGEASCHRYPAVGPFTRDEGAFIADIVRNVADGLRRSLLHRPAPGTAASVLAPGIATFT